MAKGATPGHFGSKPSLELMPALRNKKRQKEVLPSLGGGEMCSYHSDYFNVIQALGISSPTAQPVLFFLAEVSTATRGSLRRKAIGRKSHRGPRLCAAWLGASAEVQCHPKGFEVSWSFQKYWVSMDHLSHLLSFHQSLVANWSWTLTLSIFAKRKGAVALLCIQHWPMRTKRLLWNSSRLSSDTRMVKADICTEGLSGALVSSVEESLPHSQKKKKWRFCNKILETPILPLSIFKWMFEPCWTDRTS